MKQKCDWKGAETVSDKGPTVSARNIFSIGSETRKCRLPPDEVTPLCKIQYGNSLFPCANPKSDAGIHFFCPAFLKVRQQFRISRWQMRKRCRKSLFLYWNAKCHAGIHLSRTETEKAVWEFRFPTLLFKMLLGKYLFPFGNLKSHAENLFSGIAFENAVRQFEMQRRNLLFPHYFLKSGLAI